MAPAHPVDDSAGDPDIIASELEDAMSERDLAKFSLPKIRGKTRRGQNASAKSTSDYVLDIANEVAIEYRLAVCYSNFHTWDHFRKFKNKTAAAEAEVPPMFKTFANCMFMADACAKKLRAALTKDGRPDVASRVQLTTHNWQRRVKSAREYHCIAIVRLPDCCIIIDPVADGYAIKVSLNEIWQPQTSGYQYCYVGVGEATLLVQYNPTEAYNVFDHPRSKGLFTYTDPFRDIENGLAGGISNLVWPSNSYLGRLPSRRSIIVQDVWDWEPEHAETYFALRDGSGRFAVDTCRLIMDFEDPSISAEHVAMKWLSRKENTHIFNRIKSRKGFQVSLEYIPRQAFWTLKLEAFADVQKGYTKRTTDSLKVMDELLVALGMPEGEVIRIAGVMLEERQKMGRRESKKDLKRKRGDAAGAVRPDKKEKVSRR